MIFNAFFCHRDQNFPWISWAPDANLDEALANPDPPTKKKEIYDLKIVLKKLSFRFQVASSSEPGDDKI